MSGFDLRGLNGCLLARRVVRRDPRHRHVGASEVPRRSRASRLDLAAPQHVFSTRTPCPESRALPVLARRSTSQEAPLIPIRTLLVACLAGGLCAVTVADAPSETQTLYSFRDRTFSQVITSPPKTFTLGDLTLDFRAFGGLTLAAAKPTGGLAVSHRWPAGSADLDLGVYGRWRDGQSIDAGLFVGVAWRLKPPSSSGQTLVIR